MDEITVLEWPDIEAEWPVGLTYTPNFVGIKCPNCGSFLAHNSEGEEYCTVCSYDHRTNAKVKKEYV